MSLDEVLKQIGPPDESARRAARERWDSRAKPLGSLGVLEDAIADVAALTGSAEVTLKPRAVVVFCADNGVVAQGVSQSESAVTAAAVRQLARGRTAVCRMAAAADCRVLAVDMGVAGFPGCEGVLNRRVGDGAADFTQGPAMSREQAERAVLTGVELARDEAARGTRLLAAGELGIGNTTSASAVTAALLSRSVPDVTGRGAGLSDDALARKIRAIRLGLSTNRPRAWDPIDVLAKVGGFDLAGMCGLYLGGAMYRVPVLIDGFPSAAAALCAYRLCEAAGAAMLASHRSAEPAGALLLRALGKRAPIDALLRLGEGTGAVAAMPLLDMALAVYRECYSFAEGGLAPYTPQ